ncbi:MAG: LysE family transporter [Bacillota bacterium]|nr:LysE family transporter [Bacillota bacterium]MDW7682604.1 LysE family transporter [Bacillota bacterium]
MTQWGIFISAYLVGFSGALAPGPLLTLTVNESFRRGYKAGPQLITGHAILELFIVVLIAGGLHRFAGGPVFGVIAFLGSGFLLWMGWQLTTGAARGVIKLELDAAPAEKEKGLLVLGAITSLANPYFALWWLTVGAGYVVVAMNYGLPGVGAFFTGHILADYTWYTLVSTAIAGGRRFFSNTVYRVVVFCCGVFILVLAVYFFWSGFGFFSG